MATMQLIDEGFTPGAGRGWDLTPGYTAGAAASLPTPPSLPGPPTINEHVVGAAPSTMRPTGTTGTPTGATPSTVGSALGGGGSVLPANLFSTFGAAPSTRTVLTADQYSALTPAQKNAYDAQWMSPDQQTRATQTILGMAPSQLNAADLALLQRNSLPTPPGVSTTSTTSSSSNPWDAPGVVHYTPNVNDVPGMLQNAMLVAHHDTSAPAAGDVAYWQNAIKADNGAHDAAYWYNRMLGMGAGGSDIVPYGPFAGGAGYTGSTAAVTPGTLGPGFTSIPGLNPIGTPFAPGAILPSAPGAGPGVGTYAPISGLPVNVNATYPGPQFSDPGTQTLEALTTSYIDKLTQGINDPAQAQEAALIANRIKQLTGQPFTDQQSQQILTAATQQIATDRQAALQQVKEQLGSMGYQADSGPMAQALLQTNQYYDQLQTQAQQQVALHAIDVGQSNQNEAVALAQQLEGMSQGNINASNANALQAIQLAAMLADLPVSRLQVAEQAAGMGVSPQSVSDTAAKIAQLEQQGNVASANLSASEMQNLGQALGLGLVSGGSTPSTLPSTSFGGYTGLPSATSTPLASTPTVSPTQMSDLFGGTPLSGLSAITG